MSKSNVVNSSHLMFVALAFNEKINQQNLKGLSALMTDDHTFIDNSGDITIGKDEMTKGWKNFFDSYPDYQNIFSSVIVNEGVVVINGYSTCSNEPKLTGSSIWTAKIRGNKVSQWRVYWIDTSR